MTSASHSRRAMMLDLSQPRRIIGRVSSTRLTVRSRRAPGAVFTLSAFTLLGLTLACRPAPDDRTPAATAPPSSNSPASTPATAPSSSAVEIEAEYGTARLSNDPDDPAIWVHPTDPARSLILGTMKVAAPAGALVVFGLDGQIRQTITGIDRPNNVDVEYGVDIDGTPTDIAIVTERLARRLRVFRLAPDGSGVTDLGGVPIFSGVDGEAGAPMGIALYLRPSDRALFAMVSPKEGATDGYLSQFRLQFRNGRVDATHVRTFGTFSGQTPARENEIEAIAVDDALGYVYYADEQFGIRKWHADPDHPDAAKELAVFGQQGFRGDREGIALYTRPDGTGYLVCTDQLDDHSEYHVFARAGEPGRPHDHRELAVLKGDADATDGLEISSRPLGPGLPAGLMVAMNSRPQNFLIFRWQDIASSLDARPAQPAAR